MGRSDKKQILLKNGSKKTTPSHSWKQLITRQELINPKFSMNSSVSARKIGASLWEIQPPHQFNFNQNHIHPVGDGDRDGDGGGGVIQHRRRRHRRSEKDDQHTLENETSLRREIRELPSLHHLSVKNKGQELQHTSSASCCSSMQVTPYACAVTPTSYTLKTSTHLLKVLNRIWNLEEQNSFKAALIKSLKRDLDISRAQIKTLVEERKKDHQEISELKRSSHERKQKAVLPVQSTIDELFDVKSSFMRERKARILLESLCDEFAKGIRDYEQKVRYLQQNCLNKDQVVSTKEPDRLILHVSEAWLDEREQMSSDFSEKTSISDNLCCEIETFLEAKKKQADGSGVESDDLPEKHEQNKSYEVIAEQSSQLVSKMIDRDPEVVESSSRRALEGVKGNTLMAKLVEARLESQFSKSRTVRKVV